MPCFQGISSWEPGVHDLKRRLHLRFQGQKENYSESQKIYFRDSELFEGTLLNPKILDESTMEF